MPSDRFAPMTSPVFYYRPLRWKMVSAGLIAIPAAGAIGLPALRVLRAAGGIDPQLLSPLAIAVACLVFGLSALAAAAADLPRLSVTLDEIRLETFFGTQVACWSSLGVFKVVGPRHASRGATAGAPIIGPEVSLNLRGRSRFVVPDAFRMPLPELMEELDTARPYAMRAIRSWPELEDEGAIGVHPFGRPWLTYAMIAGLVAVFLEEHLRATAWQGHGAALNVATLHALGALDRTSVLEQGEWYRVLLAPLLHGSLAHLLANCVSLAMAGRILEQLAGRCWMMAIFILGGFGASMLSMAANGVEIESVGASGAIFALFTAIPILSFRLPEGDARSRVQARTFRILVPLLLPAATEMHMDFGAHLGGALVGLAAGAVLLVTWPETSKLPRFQIAAQGIIAAWMGLLMLGADQLIHRGEWLTWRAGPSAWSVAWQGGEQGARLSGDNLGRIAWLVDRRADAEAGGAGRVPGRDVGGIDAADRQHSGAGGQHRTQRA